jgi:malonyl-CoA/methylmalonyl-CoA synthetase
MTDLPGRDRLAPGALEAWRRHLGGEVDAGGLRVDLSEGSLPRVFHEIATSDPGRPALTIGGETVTHGELDRLAARAGGWIRSQDVAPGDRVVLCGGNSLDFVVGYLGILRAGAIVVLAGPTLTERELRHLVENSGAVCALAHGPALQKLSSIFRSDELVIAFEDERYSSGPSLQQAISEGESLEPQDAASDETALLAYTSGTTGRPKGVPLSHANLLSSIRAAMRAWRWVPEDVLVHALPLSHQHGLGGVHATLLSGSRAVVHGEFDPCTFCATIGSEGTTVIFAVPAIYERLVEWDGAREADFSSLRLAISGSAALSPALARRVSELLGLDVLERYGSTESGLSVSNPYDGSRKFGSVGLPLPGTELSVVDDEGQCLAPGEDGEIVLRGPQVFSSYLNVPDATREAFYSPGWFRTGDIGRVDPEDGYLTVTGRSKELIISGGLNVYPREVELALESHPEVERAAVVGAPSERWGEEVVAFMVPVKGGAVDAEALADHVREHLSAYKCPKRFIEIEELPRDEMGKVQRDELIRAAQVEARAGPSL